MLPAFFSHLPLALTAFGSGLLVVTGFVWTRFHYFKENRRQLDRMKAEFISNVSHELRTPLTSIGGYAKLLAAGDAGPVNELQREFLAIIDTNVARLTHLIDDILDVEKMQLTGLQLVREPLDIAPILKECHDTFSVLAAQKGLELRYIVAEQMPRVLGERRRLVQIFMNLISNSIKYTQEGFVELRAEASDDMGVRVSVRDSGVGLSSAEQGRLFERFYRARSIPDGVAGGLEGGTGLGLVIVRSLVEAHGGTITVESEAGRGTSFTLLFPKGSQA